MRELERNLTTLVTLDEGDAPVVSWYMAGPPFDPGRFHQQCEAIRTRLPAGLLRPVDVAIDRAIRWLERELPGGPAGVALFAREGSNPFFLGLAFPVPLPDWISVGPYPNIYHLVELKDSYHRFVVAIVHFTGVRILEVTLGAVTQELWSQRPELRARVDRSWTREHYRRYQQALTASFLKRQVKVIDRLMASGGDTHLIVAGDPEVALRLRGMLPKGLRLKLMDTREAYRRAQLSDVVAEVLESFVERKEQESQAVVDLLAEEALRGGPAALGEERVREALSRGEVDVLLLHRENGPSMSVREELARLAEKAGARVKVITSSRTLARLGGVGALLHFLRRRS